MRKKYIYIINIYIISTVLCTCGHGTPGNSFQKSKTTDSVTGSSLVGDSTSSPLNSRVKKWEIKYLTREDARKLMLGTKQLKQQQNLELTKTSSLQNVDNSRLYQSQEDDVNNEQHLQHSQPSQQHFQQSQPSQQHLQPSRQPQQHLQSQHPQQHLQHSKQSQHHLQQSPQPQQHLQPQKPKQHLQSQLPHRHLQSQHLQQSQHDHQELQHNQYQAQHIQRHSQQQVEQQNMPTTQTPPQLETPPYLNRAKPRKISLVADERGIIIQPKRTRQGNTHSLLVKAEDQLLPNQKISNRKMSQVTFIYPDEFETTISSPPQPTQSTKTSTRGSTTSTVEYTMPLITIKEDDHGITPTEGMEVISSTSDDRLALLEGRSRPQLIFFADDPEAASRIPELLTTLYDVSPSTRRIKSGFYSGHSDIITENDLEDPMMTPNPQSIHLTPIMPPIKGTGDRERNLEEEFYLQHGYHPSKYRPNQGISFPKGPTGRPPGQSITYSKTRLKNFVRVVNIEAECQDDYMRIHIKFNGSFDGLVYSSGYSHDLDCVYINGSGRNTYEFFIKLNRCGTLGSNQLEDERKPMHKNIMWNTLTVQYNPMIEEEWDEHFKVTCEYGLEIWKTVTFPFLEVEVQTGNPMLFTLSPPECHMEIRQGFGPDGPRVSSPVRVGDPLTLVIYMRSKYDGFDIVISDCYAHNGGTKNILLIDSYGCPVDDKLISHFEGQSLRDGLFETQVFAFMKTFRFTGSPALYIECGVRMCHGDCPSQQCHWRRSRGTLKKKKSKRSLNDDIPERSAAFPSTGNVSESLNLFQALQVIRDDEGPRGKQYFYSNKNGQFCFQANHFSIGAGIIASILSLLLSTCCMLCLRIRRMRKRSNSPLPPQVPFERTFKSEYVPPNKRRLE